MNLKHYFYRLPTKLREGNVFLRVCLSTGGGGPHVTITHDTLDLNIQGSSPQPHLLLVISGDHHWRPAQTCKLEDSTHPPQSYPLPPPPLISNMGPHALLVTSTGHHWRPVPTYSLDNPSPHPSLPHWY